MTTAYEYNRRWRMKNPETRHAGKKRHYAQTQGAPNTRKPWTESEDLEVLAREVTDRELSAKLGRSMQAIHARRSRLNQEV